MKSETPSEPLSNPSTFSRRNAVKGVNDFLNNNHIVPSNRWTVICQYMQITEPFTMTRYKDICEHIQKDFQSFKDFITKNQVPQGPNK